MYNLPLYPSLKGSELKASSNTIDYPSFLYVHSLALRNVIYLVSQSEMRGASIAEGDLLGMRL